MGLHDQNFVKQGEDFFLTFYFLLLSALAVNRSPLLYLPLQPIGYHHEGLEVDRRLTGLLVSVLQNLLYLHPLIHPNHSVVFLLDLNRQQPKLRVSRN